MFRPVSPVLQRAIRVKRDWTPSSLSPSIYCLRELTMKCELHIHGKTDLYRHYDENGQLLYVGISLSAIMRLSSHQASSDWADCISYVKIEKYETRNEALSAEMNAIKKEKPVHNVMHNTASSSKQKLVKTRYEGVSYRMNKKGLRVFEARFYVNKREYRRKIGEEPQYNAKLANQKRYEMMDEVRRGENVDSLI